MGAVFKDLSGQEINGIKLISISHIKNKCRYYNAICSICGEEIIVNGYEVKGKTKRGCSKCSHNNMYEDLSGREISGVKIVSVHHKEHSGIFYNCICKLCGDEF